MHLKLNVIKRITNGRIKISGKKSNYDRKTLTINVNLFVGHFTSSNYVGSVFILLDFLWPSHIGKKQHLIYTVRK